MSDRSINPRLIQRRLKLQGLELRPDALSAIQSILKAEIDPSSSLDKLIKSLREKLAKSGSKSCIVDRSLVGDAVEDLTKNDEDLILDSITVWDAFKIPYATFNTTSHTFQVTSDKREGLHGDPLVKTRMLRERLQFVHQRIMRHRLFAPRFAGDELQGTEKQVKLTPIDALAAGGGDPTQLHHVIGVLTRVDDNSLWLEDLNGKLPLDIRSNEVALGQGFFTPGCVVIVAGYLQQINQVEDEDEDENAIPGRNTKSTAASVMFRVNAMMMPPKESRTETIRCFPGTDRKLLGLPELSHKDRTSMQEMEDESEESFFIFLSEVHLDDPTCMERLHKLFQGFADYPPQLIVLLGNFSRKQFTFGTSVTTNSDQISPTEFGDLFDSLAMLMLQFPTLLGSATRWVFVPGPRDPTPSPAEIIPRPCLLRNLAERLTSKLPETCQIQFTSNPTRIMFYNQEICIFRNDTMSKMRRNCVIPPTSDTNPSENLVRTLCSQAHLSPMLLDSRPIYCGFERSLRLFPLPDVVILADHFEQYQWKYDDCLMLNPGTFASDGSFVFYRPTIRQAEYSRLDLSKFRDDE